MRRSSVAFAMILLVGWACSGAGSIPAPSAGRVKDALHSAAKTRGRGSVFAGLAVTPEGSAFLGATDEDFGDHENIRILTLRSGQQPEIFLSEKELSVAGVERIEPRTMALGPGNELLLVGYGDAGITIVGVSPKGKQRSVATLPGRTYTSYSLDATALAVDPRDGTVYLAEPCRILRAAPGAEFTLFAGDRAEDPDGQCHARAIGAEPPVLRSFLHIRGLALDPDSGALYVADSARVYRIDAAGGVVPVAGRATSDDQGLAGFSGDEGPALEARLDRPGPLAWDSTNDDLYICDLENKRIRKVDHGGTITTAVGNGNFREPYDGRATDVAVDCTQIALDAHGRLWSTAYSDVSPSDIWSERLITTTFPGPKPPE